MRLGLLFSTKGDLVGTTDALQIGDHILASFYHPLAIELGYNNDDRITRTNPWLRDSQMKKILKNFFSAIDKQNYAEMIRLHNYNFYRYGNSFSVASGYADINWITQEVNSSKREGRYKRNVNLKMADIDNARIYRNVLNWHTTVKVKIGCKYELSNPEVCAYNIYLVIIFNEENLISAIYEETLPNL